MSPNAFKRITGVACTSDAATLTARLTAHVAAETLSATAQCLIIATLVEEWGWSATEGGIKVGLKRTVANDRANIGKVLRHVSESALQITYTYAEATNAPTREAMVAAGVLCADSSKAAKAVYVVFVASRVASRVQGSPEINKSITDAIVKKGLRTVAQIDESIPTIAQSLKVVLPKRESAAENKAKDKAASAPTADKTLAAVTAFVADREAGTGAGEMFEVTAEESKVLMAAIAAGIDTLLAAQCFDEVNDVILAAKSNLARAKKDAEDRAQHMEDRAANQAAGAAIAEELKYEGMGVRANKTVTELRDEDIRRGRKK